MDLLNSLIEKCKCSISIDINTHRDYNESVLEHIKILIDTLVIETDDIPPEILEEMIKRNTIINIHFYPQTSVGFYSIYHYDLEQALKLCHETF